MYPFLITGGCGFIGSNFILNLLEQDPDAQVLNLDCLSYAANPSNLKSIEAKINYSFVRGGIGDSDLVRKLLQQYEPSVIVNFAAESHVDRSIDNPQAFVETNVLATTRFLEEIYRYWKNLAAERQKDFRFLHVSTDEVYGSLTPEAAPFAETTPYAPNSPYAASKAASDHFVRAYHHTYGLPTLIGNCSNNYGPYQFPEKLIPLIISNALMGKPLPIYGDGKNIRDWLYVEDHCHALRLILQKGKIGESYNIGGQNEKSNWEIVHAICSILDELRLNSPHHPHAQLIRFVPDRPGHDRRYAIDARKIESELGWKPRHHFETGIRKTIQWYLDHPEWIEAIQQRGEFQDWIKKQYA